MTSSTFADAQRRVLERQAQREAAARAALSQPATNSDTLLSRLSTSSTSLLSRITSREGTRPPFRVGQVDAELLDEELLTLLKDQVGDALKYYSSSLREDYASEILFSLRAVLFKLSIWDHNATYGATLQGLNYTDARSSSIVPPPPTRWQKASYGLLTVFGRYAWEKWEAYLVSESSEDYSYYTTPSTSSSSRTELISRLSRLTSLTSTTHSLASIISFLIFLVNGRYRTLTDRLLRLRLVPASSQISREVSFEYLNRQLVWHAFTEFLLFLLPLVGIGRWRRWLSRAWRRAKNAIKKSSQDADAEAEEIDGETEKSGPLAYLPERTCAICYADQNPESTSEAELLGVNNGSGTGLGSGGVIGSATTDIVNPYETIPCKCIYCFVCIATKIEAEEGEGWTCLRCGEIVKQCRPWDGDVVSSSLLRSDGAGNKKKVEFDDSPQLPSYDLDPENVAATETANEQNSQIPSTSTSIPKSRYSSPSLIDNESTSTNDVRNGVENEVGNEILHDSTDWSEIIQRQALEQEDEYESPRENDMSQ
ncbi:putative peroxisome biosynthesis protein (peroxin-2) [Phaeomoniella chlamydospora]|uniref:Putative peroxisome biosynthesis protein (Peroxin-2) n=1 Tax=Phaeomoniella chlamydospora TaxID=158046 RepID=A0A0G2G2D8_PHACM|nr:putative peroxisome biosynthesis protein (peroxin-2) [Phaeomoniella chlamydospora]